jgi:multidrug efflux pump subunit AcrA (membrane-fusion protein)
MNSFRNRAGAIAAGAVCAFGLAAFTFSLAGCGGSEPETAPVESLPAATVVVERLALTEWPETYEAVGTVRARYSAEVSSRIPSLIQQVHVRAGDQVRAGQLLVELDARDLDSNVRQAEAAKVEAENAILEATHAEASAQTQLQLAEVTHKRFAELLEKRSVSPQEYDEAEARLQSAKAAVAMAAARKQQAEAKRSQAESGITAAKVAAGYATIHAPFAGTVTERRLDPGSLASPGMPILMLDQAGAYLLEAAVPESRLAMVRVGQQVTVRIEALAGDYSGQVMEIVPEVDAASRTFTAKITLPNRRELRGGMFGRAIFPGSARQLLTAPANAVTERGQVQSIFVAADGVARRRLVSLGSELQDRYEVLAGLEAGELVVLDPGSLQDGQGIQIRETVTPRSDTAGGDTAGAPASETAP